MKKKKKNISVIPFFCEQILDTEKNFQKKNVKISIEAALHRWVHFRPKSGGWHHILVSRIEKRDFVVY